MLGFNGGLRGKRRGPATDAASGLWSPNEQSVAKREDAWPYGMAANPNFSSVSLLLHMDGSNNSTTFTDSSSTARPINRFGDAKISTTQSKFSGASGLFDGTGDYLTTTIASAIGTGPYTFEGFFYPVDNSSWRTILTVGGIAVYWHQGAVIGYGGNIPGSDLRSKQGQFGSKPALSLNTWHHFALTRTSNGIVYVFADGLQGGLSLGTSSNTVTGNTFNASSTAMNIASNGAGGEFFNGYLDELRIARDAVYTTNFTPPTAPFPEA